MTRTARAGRPPKRDDRLGTQARVLAAAEAEFARAGFDAARLEDIALAAGIRRPSLLFHFESKQALYAAVVRGAFAALGAALEAGILESGGFALRFDAAVHALVRFLDARPAVAPLILRELLDDRGPGQALLLEAGVPILQRMERFLKDEGAGVLKEDAPPRAALSMIFSGALVRAASGALREPLFGKTDKTRALARLMLMKE